MSNEHRKTILVVDDEPDIRLMLADYLMYEYTVLTARGGKEALQIIKQSKQKIDMVILDMIMPDMSGSDTYNGLMVINPNLKVLLCSGYSVDGQATEILDRGCEGFIQKPFNLRDLSTKVRETFEKKHEACRYQQGSA